MKGAEHYKAAEAAHEACVKSTSSLEYRALLMQEAQYHATMALAAATAWGHAERPGFAGASKATQTGYGLEQPPVEVPDADA